MEAAEETGEQVITGKKKPKTVSSLMSMPGGKNTDFGIKLTPI